MRLFGYAEDADADDEKPTRLTEVTICADPGTVKKLAEFLVAVATKMEEHGDDFGHEHFEDYDSAQQGGPALIVTREQ